MTFLVIRRKPAPFLYYLTVCLLDDDDYVYLALLFLTFLRFPDEPFAGMTVHARTYLRAHGAKVT